MKKCVRVQKPRCLVPVHRNVVTGRYTDRWLFPDKVDGVALLCIELETASTYVEKLRRFESGT